jgi:poly(beta-D-mannuronate) lyase
MYPFWPPFVSRSVSTSTPPRPLALPRLLCFSALLLGAPACQPPPDELDEAVAEATFSGTYLLQVALSARCADVAGGSLSDGAAIQQAACDARASERWQLHDLGADTYEVKSAAGKCLDVAGNSLADGATVLQWTCKQSKNQQWKLVSAGGGLYRLQAVSSGKCLAVASASLADGAIFQQATCADPQKLRFLPIGNAKLATGGGAVAASSNDGNLPANVVDGSLATRWSASGDGQWLRFDLGANRHVSFIKVAPYNGTARVFTFDVQTSLDGAAWTTRAAAVKTALDNQLQTFDFPDVDPARFVRLVGHGCSTSAWNTYTEVEIYGGLASADLCAAETDAAFCSRLGKRCGSVTAADNCGHSRSVASCGSCASPLSCGGAGTPNVCGCAPESDAAFCSRLGKACGSVVGTDNCGAPRSVATCGGCAAPLVCGGAGVPNVCGALPGEPPLPACVRTVPVATSAALATATSGARAGDCIVLADGPYTFPTLSAKGTASSPIVIRAAHPQKATVSSGKLTYDGAAYLIVEGLLWQADAIKLNNCDHCRLSRSRLMLAEPAGADYDWVTVSGTSKSCRIDHNELGPKNVIGNMIMLGGSGAQAVQDTRIDHNFFHDVNRTSGNGWETIRAGLSGWTFSSARSVIEQNLFKRCSGDPETVSLKSSDNILRYNTMRATAGELTLRHGNRTSVYGNYILGDGVAAAGGIRVLGGDHKIYDNYIEGVSGAGIFLEGGESDDMTGMLTDHKQVYRAQVVFNTVVNPRGITVGGSHPLEPIDCTVAFNILQGSGTLLNEATGTVGTKYLGNIVKGTSAIKDAIGVRLVDPRLVRTGEILKLGAGSPAIDTADGSFAFVNEDFEGQPRSKPDVGADEVSTATPTRHLLGESDVGPLAP